MHYFQQTCHEHKLQNTSIIHDVPTVFRMGAWFTTLGTVLTAQDMSGVIGAAYGAVPKAAIIAPLFLGLIADRFFNCEKTMGILHLVGGALLFAGPSLIANKQGDTLSYIILANMLCYMPTLGLSNTVAFTNIRIEMNFQPSEFGEPLVGLSLGWWLEVWGCQAALENFYHGWSCRGHSRFALFCLTKNTPPSRDKPINIGTLFMVDALKLMTSIPFLCLHHLLGPGMHSSGLLLCLHGGLSPPNRVSSNRKHHGARQISEIFFMLLVPFFFRKLGVKIMILVGMLAWVARLRALCHGSSRSSGLDDARWSDPSWHLRYDFFFVTGFIAHG